MINKVFVVILNWNRAKDTIDALVSVSNLTIKDYKLDVIVIDNASSDNSLREITSKTQKLTRKLITFHIIKNKENLGFAAGNNVGLMYALKNKADFVMTLNNDTVVHPDLLIRLIEAARRNPDLGSASPKIYFAKGFEFHKDRYIKTDLGEVLWYGGGDIDWANVYGKTRGVDEVDKGQYDKVEETDFATGACMFIRRNVLEKSGLFDEKYFMYYEDTDLSLRIKKNGFKLFYIPQAIVWHKVAQSSGIGSELNDYFITRNRLLFGMKYAKIRSRFALYRESLRLLSSGRKWQKKGVIDFYLGRFGKGSWR